MKLSFANMQSDLTSGQRFDLQRSMFTEFKHNIFQFCFSFITSDLLGLGRWFWRLCVSLVKASWMIPILTPKGQVKNLTWGQGQVRSNWVMLHIIRFGVMRQTIDATFTRLCHPVQELWAETCFPHRLTMGEVKNWPDLVSRNWKIRDIHFVGIHVRIWSWKFEVIRTKTVSLARP